MVSATRVYCDRCRSEDDPLQSVVTFWRFRDLPVETRLDLCAQCEDRFFRTLQRAFARFGKRVTRPYVRKPPGALVRSKTEKKPTGRAAR